MLPPLAFASARKLVALMSWPILKLFREVDFSGQKETKQKSSGGQNGWGGS